jgi:hypothetical protein
MSTGWKLYRIVCVLQMIAAAFILFSTLFDFFRHASFADVFKLILFLLVMLLSIFAVNLLNSNYPETPVTGNQKKSFNRLFLLNFIFLAVLFGLIIAEYRTLKLYAILLNKPMLKLQFASFIMLLGYIVVLIFQFIILYGLYDLRRLLYVNFNKKKFDFEVKS